MTTKQVQKLAGQLVEHQDAFEVMSSDDRQWAIQNTKQAIEVFSTAVRRVNQGLPDIMLPEGLCRSDMVTTLAKFEAPAIDIFDLERYFSNGRSYVARSESFKFCEKEIPSRTLKLVKIDPKWGSRLFSVMRLLGHEPVVHFSHVHEFIRAWNRDELMWVNEAARNVFQFSAAVSDGSTKLCGVNCQGLKDKSWDSDWFLHSSRNVAQTKGYDESVVLVN